MEAGETSDEVQADLRHEEFEGRQKSLVEQSWILHCLKRDR